MEKEILPTHTIPLHYNLEIKPNLDNTMFDGIVKIDVRIIKETDNIIVNGRDINITNVYLECNNALIKVTDVIYNKETEQIKFQFDYMITPGVYLLVIMYNALLTEKLLGFYKCNYEKTTILATQFEPTHCRCALPCWDEPGIKAKFTVNLIIPKNKIGLSNTQQIEETNCDPCINYKKVTFETTPLMSTYLLAFLVIDEYESIQTKSQNNILINVWTPKGRTEEGLFALDIASKALDYFTEYFGIQYPLNKIDLIPIPNFEAGAMENWGLITFRFTCLLAHKETTLDTKKEVAYTICHELAHQWFGNLVTMDWWSGLWLNEATATYFGWMATDYLFPEWNVWTSFLNDDYMCGMELDSLETSHPIDVPIQKASEVDEIFDAISYSKGSCVIKMLIEFLGKDTFQKGIQYYLKKHIYQNATANDLWNALSYISKYDILTMMNTWTFQKGYPYVNINIIDKVNCKYMLEQKKYTLDEKNG
ncbi:MAG: hypothetical protein Edafosvirus65_1, partial [Edafosvirus sp.]